MRILLTGGPGTGKTTLAPLLSPSPLGIVFHTDDYIDPRDWHTCSEIVSHLLDEPGPWLIEGVKVPNALRKWRERNPGKRPPCDKVIWLQVPKVERSEGARRMGVSHDTILRELRPWLGRLLEVKRI
jgi:adenylate kinase family enzyme